MGKKPDNTWHMDSRAAATDMEIRENGVLVRIEIIKYRRGEWTLDDVKQIMKFVSEQSIELSDET